MIGYLHWKHLDYEALLIGYSQKTCILIGQSSFVYCAFSDDAYINFDIMAFFWENCPKTPSEYTKTQKLVLSLTTSPYYVCCCLLSSCSCLWELSPFELFYQLCFHFYILLKENPGRQELLFDREQHTKNFCCCSWRGVNMSRNEKIYKGTQPLRGLSTGPSPGAEPSKISVISFQAPGKGPVLSTQTA